MGSNGNMCGDVGFLLLAGYCRRYYGGAVLVANIVLDYEHRPYTALLGTDYGA
jgi:hypothetical protein